MTKVGCGTKLAVQQTGVLQDLNVFRSRINLLCCNQVLRRVSGFKPRHFKLEQDYTLMSILAVLQLVVPNRSTRFYNFLQDSYSSSDKHEKNGDYLAGDWAFWVPASILCVIMSLLL